MCSAQEMAKQVKVQREEREVIDFNDGFWRSYRSLLRIFDELLEQVKDEWWSAT